MSDSKPDLRDSTKFSDTDNRSANLIGASKQINGKRHYPLNLTNVKGSPGKKQLQIAEDDDIDNVSVRDFIKKSRR